MFMQYQIFYHHLLVLDHFFRYQIIQDQILYRNMYFKSGILKMYAKINFFYNKVYSNNLFLPYFQLNTTFFFAISASICYSIVRKKKSTSKGHNYFQHC